MTSKEKRAAVTAVYKTILGRNYYSQPRRDYCLRKYSDGRYYSDCSSSISYCYRKAGFDFGVLNTVSMYHSGMLTDVDVRIKNGIIQNPEALRVGDLLLFAGGDAGRSYAGYVGHVEMVYAIGSRVTIAGHGSGRPRTTELNAYCRSRYAAKTKTKLGNRGLIRVRRLIQDDAGADPAPGTRTLTNGATGSDVKAMQAALIRLDYDLGRWGADGDYGDCTEMAVAQYQTDHGLTPDGVCWPDTLAAITASLAKLDAPAAEPRKVRIVGGSCYVRDVGSAGGRILGIAQEGAVCDYAGETNEHGWLQVRFGSGAGWVSGRYGRLE